MINAMLILRVQNLSKAFQTREKTQFIALKDINLDVGDGEFVSFLGASGCGKTTLLRILAGLEKPSTGKVLLDGKEIIGPRSERAMVFQEYTLFPWRTVIKNIQFGLELKKVEKNKREEIAKKFIRLVGLEGFENNYPVELSGGMRQRVAIATVLANEPRIILMDEPFGALDAQTRNTMQGELLNIWEKENKTIVFVTHSVDEAIFLSDRIVVLQKCPGMIKKIIHVDMPRLRDRNSKEFVEMKKEITNLIGVQETNKSNIPEPAHELNASAGMAFCGQFKINK